MYTGNIVWSLDTMLSYLWNEHTHTHSKWFIPTKMEKLHNRIPTYIDGYETMCSANVRCERFPIGCTTQNTVRLLKGKLYDVVFNSTNINELLSVKLRRFRGWNMHAMRAHSFIWNYNRRISKFQPNSKQYVVIVLRLSVVIVLRLSVV